MYYYSETEPVVKARFFLFANDYKHDIIRIDEIVQKRISEFSQLQIVIVRGDFFCFYFNYLQPAVANACYKSN